MTKIHVFHHTAMATRFQARMAGADEGYVAQAAQAVFALVDSLEAKLSRFRANSEIAHIAQLGVGEKLRLTEPVFACLHLARQMEAATHGTFSVSAAARLTQPAPPIWTLDEQDRTIRCDRGRLEFDLGAIGKGFALDRAAQVLREWDCPAFLLIAGGSSILAGEAPPGTDGWSCGLGDDDSPKRYWLKHVSLSGSGLAVKGPHILDPRTGQPAAHHRRTWALAVTAAESDALSTASMLLSETEISEMLRDRDDWLVFFQAVETWRYLGARPLPPEA